MGICGYGVFRKGSQEYQGQYGEGWLSGQSEIYQNPKRDTVLASIGTQKIERRFNQNAVADL
jgi:hypothetical protein